MIDRIQRTPDDEHITRTASTCHAWRGDDSYAPYADVPGFCTAMTLEEGRGHGHVLTPGRNIRAAAMEDDGESHAAKMARLPGTLEEQFAEAPRLEMAIRMHLGMLANKREEP